MSTLDIRSAEVDSVDNIVFADQPIHGYTVSTLLAKWYENKIAIAEEPVNEDFDTDGDFVLIGSEKDALNLIKALQKAIELSWFKEE